MISRPNGLRGIVCGSIGQHKSADQFEIIVVAEKSENEQRRVMVRRSAA